MKVCESSQKTVWHTVGDNQLFCWEGFKLLIPIAGQSTAPYPPPPLSHLGWL